jgi:hypothetical protein
MLPVPVPRGRRLDGQPPLISDANSISRDSSGLYATLTMRPLRSGAGVHLTAEARRVQSEGGNRPQVDFASTWSFDVRLLQSPNLGGEAVKID